MTSHILYNVMYESNTIIEHKIFTTAWLMGGGGGGGEGRVGEGGERLLLTLNPTQLYAPNEYL